MGLAAWHSSFIKMIRILSDKWCLQCSPQWFLLLKPAEAEHSSPGRLWKCSWIRRNPTCNRSWVTVISRFCFDWQWRSFSGRWSAIHGNSPLLSSKFLMFLFFFFCCAEFKTVSILTNKFKIILKISGADGNATKNHKSRRRWKRNVIPWRTAKRNESSRKPRCAKRLVTSLLQGRPVRWSRCLKCMDREQQNRILTNETLEFVCHGWFEPLLVREA